MDNWLYSSIFSYLAIHGFTSVFNLKNIKDRILLNMEQELINKMAEAIYNAKYSSQGGKWYAVETKDVWVEIAKAALAAIQEDYVLVRKEDVIKVSPPDKNNNCVVITEDFIFLQNKDIVG